MLGIGEADGAVAGRRRRSTCSSPPRTRTSPRRCRRLREVDDAPLILAAYGEPNGIVETGLAVGAADVLVLPQPAETLLFALRKAASAAADTTTGKVVTVFSPKGGSGKTVLATNLAVAAARSGVKTLLVDLDLQFGDSALTLGGHAAGDDRRPRRLRRRHRRREAEGVRHHRRPDGLAVLPAPRRPEEADVVGQAELAAVLDAARSAYDAVVDRHGPAVRRRRCSPRSTTPTSCCSSAIPR